MQHIPGAVRSAATMTRSEIEASASRRLAQLAQKHGADSPQVRAALVRWARILDHQTRSDDDLMAMVRATRGA